MLVISAVYVHYCLVLIILTRSVAVAEKADNVILFNAIDCVTVRSAEMDLAV